MTAKVIMQKNFSKRRAQLDWSLPAMQLERNIRAFNPWPIAYFSTEDKDGNPQT